MELDQEKYLIERVQKYGDSEAFGRLYDEYYQAVLRFLLYRTGDEDLAKDLTSETFFQALKSVWRFRWQSKPFSAWLYRIAHNQMLNYLRKNKAYCQLTQEQAPDLLEKDTIAASLVEAEDEKERLQQYQTLYRAMQELTEIQHTIVVMRYFSKKSLKEIALSMSLPLNTVKSHIRRSLKRLADIFHREEHVTVPVPSSEHLGATSSTSPVQPVSSHRVYESNRTKT